MSSTGVRAHIQPYSVLRHHCYLQGAVLVLGGQWASTKILGRSLPIGKPVHKPFLAILGFRQDWVVIRGCLVDKHWPCSYGVRPTWAFDYPS